MTLEERTENAKRRKERILQYIKQDPPVPLSNIQLMEGMSERPLRLVIKELEAEHGIKYIATSGARSADVAPYGLTDSTARLRGRLSRELIRCTNSDNEFGFRGRAEVAPAVGLNPREQIRAEEAPFTHDWTLSQIERLARQLGEDPRELLLKCLTT